MNQGVVDSLSLIGSDPWIEHSDAIRSHNVIWSALEIRDTLTVIGNRVRNWIILSSQNSSVILDVSSRVVSPGDLILLILGNVGRDLWGSETTTRHK